MSDGGKGSAPRPVSIDQSMFDSNWENIFGKKTKRPDDYQDILSTEDCILAALDKLCEQKNDK